MKKYTTFKVGGPAECLIKIDNEADLKEILEFAKINNIPLTILGNGSNVIVLDSGIKGITLIIKIEKLEIENSTSDVVKNQTRSRRKNSQNRKNLFKRRFAGFEEISGIPGTVGGATRMNAGAHGKEMKDIITKSKMPRYEWK